MILTTVRSAQQIGLGLVAEDLIKLRPPLQIVCDGPVDLRE